MSKSSSANPASEPWYDSAFQGDYLKVYAHRDETAARDEVDFIMSQTPPRARARILDIACGAGRHLLWLAKQAELALGLDRSSQLLAAAAARLAQVPNGALLVRADMRQLPFEREFTCVTLLFTSFGYFPTDQENLSVIAQAGRVLKSDGIFWLDYMNEPQVRRTLKPFTRHSCGEMVIEQRRRITEDGRVEKQINIVGKNEQRCLNESVKLYSRVQVEEMFAQCGLSVEGLWGDFQGNPHSSDSPRLIIMGRKNG